MGIASTARGKSKFLDVANLLGFRVVWYIHPSIRISSLVFSETPLYLILVPVLVLLKSKRYTSPKMTLV